MSQRMETLALGARTLGMELTPHQLDLFEAYYRELADWNQRVNLTAITGYQEVQVKHFLDSLTVCRAVPVGAAAAMRVIDVGAGAGLPGLPLKLAFPDIQLALVESVGKKARFLEHLVATLALSGVEVLTGRAEELARLPRLRENFDLVVSRGVAKLPSLLEYTLPFCAPGGRAAVWKRGGIEEEIASSDRALAVLGGGVPKVYPVEVSSLADGRVLVVVQKTAPTPDRYPRRPGIPDKRPL